MFALFSFSNFIIEAYNASPIYIKQYDKIPKIINYFKRELIGIVNINLAKLESKCILTQN